MNRKLKIVVLAAMSVILIALGLVGCSSGVVKKGWAGVAAINDTLIFINMSGRIYSLDGATNTVKGTPVKFEITSSGSGLSCIPTCGGPVATPISVYASPAIGGEMAIIGGFDGRVYAYPLLEGQLREQYRWKYPPDGDVGGNIVGGLAVGEDKVFFSSVKGTVFALNAAEGYKVWSIELGNKVWSAPAVEGDTLYIGCFDKNIYALNTADGSIRWQYKTEGAISATPIIDNGIIYFGGYDRTFYAVDAATGKLVWQFPVTGAEANKPDNWFWVKPVLHNGLIYAPNLDGKVYVLDASNGVLKRVIEFTTGFAKPAVSASPVVVGEMVVVAVIDLTKAAGKVNSNTTSKIFAIDTAAGKETELTSFKEAVNAPLFAYNGIVYVHTSMDNYFAINPLNGATQSISLTVSTSK